MEIITNVRGFLSKETFDILEVNKKEIKQGDLILFENEVKTVCKNNISYDSFIGISIFGNSYQKVKKVINYKR